VVDLRAASEGDLAVVRLLLAQAGLPISDLGSTRPEFTVLSQDGRVVAAGALERYGSSALLRSVVVAGDRRGTGLGRAIVRELEQRACASGIGRLVLLTQTAAEFFADQGYRVIERFDAPRDVQASAEFRSLCPASATCMMKQLTTST
jgi:amino-acid N-acetyltransferase